MSVAPSCPILLIHEDDAFRKKLIAALDQRHFTVTFSDDGPDVMKAIHERPFVVILISIDVPSRKGFHALDYVRAHREQLGDASIILVGDAHPELRRLARYADETLMKPVDPVYVAERARGYC